MDAPTTTPPRAPADHPAARRIALILRPLYARIIRSYAAAPVDPALPPAPPAPAAQAEPEAAPVLEIADAASFFAAIEDTARHDMPTVAEARALIADPQAAVEQPEIERQVAWLIAKAELEQRMADAACLGGTAA